MGTLASNELVVFLLRLLISELEVDNFWHCVTEIIKFKIHDQRSPEIAFCSLHL